MTWFGIDNVHVNRIDLDNGMSFSGFEGCVSYRRSGTAKVGPSYTQREAKKLIRKLPAGRRPAVPLPAARRQRRPRRSGPHRLRGAARRGCSSTSRRWLLHGHVHPDPGQPAQPDRRHAGRSTSTARG